MTTKQRAYLKGLAMNLDPIFQIGKNSMTPEVTKAIQEALDARELIKVSVLLLFIRCFRCLLTSAYKQCRLAGGERCNREQYGIPE